MPPLLLLATALLFPVVCLGVMLLMGYLEDSLVETTASAAEPVRALPAPLAAPAAEAAPAFRAAS